MPASPLTAMTTWLAGRGGMGRKDNPVGQAIASLISPGRPVYTPRSFEALAREGFTKNGYVFRAVTIIAEACAGIPWKLYQDTGKQGSQGSQGSQQDSQGTTAVPRRSGSGGKVTTTELDDHPLLDLLNRPHGEDDIIGSGDLIEQLIAYRYLTGNAYLTAVRPTSRLAPPQELWVQRPDRMKVVPDASGHVSGYLYTIGNKQQSFDAAHVLHWKTFNPIDDWYGLSPVGVAARVVDQMNAGNDWNTALLQNMARPGGFLMTPVGTKLSDQQFDRLEKLLKRLYQGAQNAGRPHILEGGLTWQQIGMSPIDMDWLTGKKENAREIAVTLGVPSELLGDSANKTYSNYQEARRAFYMEVVLPLMDRLRDALNAWLVPMYGDARLRLEYDKDDIEALQEDRDAMHARAREDYAGGIISLNEAREIIGHDVIEKGDVWIVPKGALTLDQLLEGAGLPLLQVPGAPATAHPQLPAGQPSDTAPHPPTALPVPGANDDPAAADPGQKRAMRPRAVKAVNLRSDEQKAAHWRATEASRTRWYAAVQQQVQAQFQTEHAAVKQALLDGHTPTIGMARALNTMDSFTSDWQTLLTTIYLSVAKPFAQDTYASLKAQQQKQAQRTRGTAGPGRLRKDTSADAVEIPDAWQEYVSTWLTQNAGTKVSQITDTTRTALQALLAAGVENGDSLLDIADELDSLYLDDLIPNRSLTIASTEVIGASNLGSLAGAQTLGLAGLQKMWIATRDSHTRETHADADGQTVGIDESFEVGGEELEYPGDASGSAENVVNCRCTVGYDTSGVTGFSDAGANDDAGSAE